MAKECAARGVVVETDADVTQLLVEGGKSVGVALADGRELRADTVVSNLNPKLLYTKLVDPGVLDADTAQRIERYRYEIGRPHVCTPATHAHLVCRHPLEQKNTTHPHP